MSLEPGRTLLHYRLTEKIGQGGMGVVWKALDTTLDRNVAIKVLPEAFALDSERLARFQREAKLLASLNHPNIATVHGLHEVEGVRFLAMELVEGQDLAKELAAGPVSMQRALNVGRQIAEALEAAHDNGIIHRDLKPANVLVSSDGHVKVLDFGLAKPHTGESGEADPSMSPTLTSAGTQAGMILGTAAYLSPEQAKAHNVDRRTDIWAFGVVLHEMLTGRRTFEGEGISETLAAVILKEPDLERLPANTPPRVRETVRRCLIKDPRNRLRDIGEARIALEEALADPNAGATVESSAPPAVSAEPQRRRPWIAIAAATLLAAAAFAVGRALSPEPASQSTVRVNVELAADQGLDNWPGSAVAISPDGRRIAFSMGDPPRLHLRDMEHLEDTVLSGTEEARNPFFSPDGQWLAFFDNSHLKKVSISGGAPLTLAEARRGRGGTWGPDDTIIYAPFTVSGLRRVSAAGGESEEITTPVRDDQTRERSHRWPQFLPGGKAVLFTSQLRGSNFNEANVEVLDLESGERTVLHRGGSYGRYVEGGFLVFAREGTLFAARFDARRLKMRGSPVPVLEQIGYHQGNGGAKLEFSPSGTMVYMHGDRSETWTSSLNRVDRDGTATELPLDPGKYADASLSPDGRYLAFSHRDASETISNIWIFDLERDVSTRLTFEESWEWWPAWMPDGRYVSFSSERGGDMQIYRKPFDGSEDVELLTPDTYGAWSVGSWSPDGKILVYTQFEDSNDLRMLNLEDATDSILLRTDAGELFPAYSPDGKWIAYQSDESGGNEIYVRPSSGSGGKWQISRGGGSRPVWSRDGTELFFIATGSLMRAPVGGEGDSFHAGRSEELFEIDRRVLGRYDVGRDGSFYMTLRQADETPDETRALVTFVFDWPGELDRLVPE